MRAAGALRVGGRRVARAQLRLAHHVHRHHAQPGAEKRRGHRGHTQGPRQLRASVCRSCGIRPAILLRGDHYCSESYFRRDHRYVRRST